MEKIEEEEEKEILTCIDDVKVLIEKAIKDSDIIYTLEINWSTHCYVNDKYKLVLQSLRACLDRLRVKLAEIRGE